MLHLNSRLFFRSLFMLTTSTKELKKSDKFQKLLLKGVWFLPKISDLIFLEKLLHFAVFCS